LCNEANISPAYRKALRAPRQSLQSVITNVFTGRPARALETRIVRELGPMAEEIPVFPLAAAAIAPLRAKSEPQGSTDFTPLWCGQAARLSPELPAAKLVAWLCNGFIQNETVTVAGALRDYPGRTERA